METRVLDIKRRKHDREGVCFIILESKRSVGTEFEFIAGSTTHSLTVVSLPANMAK